MINEDRIDYVKIGRAQTYYRAVGYKNIDVPWMASFKAVMATMPPGRSVFQTPAGCLVGSGEQGFIDLILKGELQPGRYQCTTPCFRDEPEYNELTRISFFKTELIWYMPEDARAAFEEILNTALACFFEVSDATTFEGVQTDEGMDIYFNGIELGSYGVRKMDSHIWAYGTGLAEPRFSIAMRKQHQLAAISLTTTQPDAIQPVESHPTSTEPDTSTSLTEQAPA
jgi:hypothetical protein